MNQFLIMLGVLIVAVAIYWPILRIAREDMADRARAGLSNSIVYAVLLLPLVGPVVYLVFSGGILRWGSKSPAAI